MLSILLFLIIISAFAVFSCVRWGRRFEETLPISAMGIVLILFIFGLCNILSAGVFAVCALTVLIYLYSIYWIIKNRSTIDFKKTVFNIITPATVIFAVASLLIAYCNKGRLATLTDEFSHWLDTVVIMTRIDDFGTAPNSTAVFPSYPPAMSLFQYLLEKLTLFCGGEFSEWKAYFAYQLMAVVIALPFVTVSEKSVAKRIAGCLLWWPVLIAPLYFFGQAYNSLYIDPFLGILGGCGFTMVALCRNKDWVYVTYMTMLCSILTLSKDVGIYLALFIGLFFFVDSASRIGAKSVKDITLSIAPLFGMAAAKLLWKLELTIAHTELKFSAPFDVKGVIATLQGNGSDYYNKVYNNFKIAITYRDLYYERIGTNYVGLMTLLTVLFVALFRRMYLKTKINKATAIAGSIIPAVAIVCYILSMFPLYVSRFVEEEALNLASFDRYCGIMFLTGVILLIFLLRDALLDIEKPAILLCAAILIVLSVHHSQTELIRVYIERESVQQSIDYRSAVNTLATKINGCTSEDAQIILIGQDEDSFANPILETISKPRRFVFNGENISEYDYVAIYRPTDSLLENYSDKFENPEDINILTLFKVTENGKLKLVQ